MTQAIIRRLVELVDENVRLRRIVEVQHKVMLDQNKSLTLFINDNELLKRMSPN